MIYPLWLDALCVPWELIPMIKIRKKKRNCVVKSHESETKLRILGEHVSICPNDSKSFYTDTWLAMLTATYSQQLGNEKI